MVDANGAPVAGASVAVVPHGCEGQADAEGRFEIAGRIRDVVRCVAHAPGKGLALGPWLTFGSGDKLDAGTLRLRPGPALRGRAVDPSGAGVAGVFVDLAREGPRSEEWEALLSQIGWQETGEDGAFAFEGLDEGPYRVTVRAYDPATDDDARQTREHLRPGGKEVLFVVPAALKTVKGMISVLVTLPDGSPLPRATLRSGTQDGSGSAEIENGRGSVNVEGKAPAWLAVLYPCDGNDAPLPYRPAYLADPAPRDEPYAIVLEPGETIGGTVATADGMPLHASVEFHRTRADAAVSADADAEKAIRDLAGSHDVAESDALGRFRCTRLAPGEYAVRATCAGYTSIRPYVVARTGTLDLRIEMRRAGRILLRVVAPEGEIIGGGRFTVMARHASGWVEQGTQTVSVGSNSRCPSLDTRFAGLHEGEVYRIRATVSRPGLGRYAPVDVDAVAGDGEAVVVHLALGGTVTGRVLRADGSPVVSAEVKACVPPAAPLAWFDGTGGTIVGRASSGPDGRFELGGTLDDTFWVTCGASGLVQSGGPCAVGAQDTEVEIRLEPELDVSGRIEGDGPLDFRVEAIPSDLEGEAASIPRDFEFSGEDGFFALGGLFKGAVAIDGWRPWEKNDDRYVHAEGIEAGAGDLRLAILRGAHIEGTVQDRDGQPVGDAMVFVTGSWGTRDTRTDTDGRFVLQALPPGHHVVRLEGGESVGATAPGPPLHLVR